jgi:hypothetical protein
MTVLVCLVPMHEARAQTRGTPPPTARASAPIDLTGYWVSVVTQDWRWRMVTPAKGDYASIPITIEAKKVGDAWDPAKDEAAGEQCKSYGAPAIRRTAEALAEAGQVRLEFDLARSWLMQLCARLARHARITAGSPSSRPGTRRDSSETLQPAHGNCVRRMDSPFHFLPR